VKKILELLVVNFNKPTLAVLGFLFLGISCNKEYSYEGPAPTGPVSIFTSQAPAGITANDNNGSGIELGVRFRSTIAGYILGIKFYKTPGNIGTHSAQLYSFDGTLLASADFINETDSGWQSVLFSSAVPITANTTYIGAYFSSLGNYAYTPFGFNSAITNGPLTGLADGADGINGLYKYTGMPAFPGLGHLSDNYWVDVIESGYPGSN
jgi:Domain of unknown function (DUF4082)